MGWKGRGSNPGVCEIFRTCPDRPWGPPSLLYNGYRVFPGVNSGRSVTLIPHPLVVPWSWKGRAIPLLPLWAVRPIQSLSACTRVHFTLPFLCNIKKRSYFRNVWKYSPKEKELLFNRLDYPALISVSTSALFRTRYGYTAHSNESAMKNILNRMLKKKVTRSVMATNQQMDLLVFNG